MNTGMLKFPMLLDSHIGYEMKMAPAKKVQCTLKCKSRKGVSDSASCAPHSFQIGDGWRLF